MRSNGSSPGSRTTSHYALGFDARKSVSGWRHRMRPAPSPGDQLCGARRLRPRTTGPRDDGACGRRCGAAGRSWTTMRLCARPAGGASVAGVVSSAVAVSEVARAGRSFLRAEHLAARRGRSASLHRARRPVRRRGLSAPSAGSASHIEHMFAHTPGARALVCSWVKRTDGSISSGPHSSWPPGEKGTCSASGNSSSSSSCSVRSCVCRILLAAVVRSGSSSASSVQPPPGSPPTTSASP